METQQNQSNIQEMAKTAAKFWANFLRQQEPIIHDAGMRHEQEIEFSMRVTAIGNLLRNQTKVSPDQADIFEHELSQIIQFQIEREGRDYISFGVDYHPDMELRSAAALASFDPEMQFPVKTQMYIHNGQVSVKEGYGAPVRVLYPETEETPNP